jgi:hypothetical protein
VKLVASASEGAITGEHISRQLGAGVDCDAQLGSAPGARAGEPSSLSDGAMTTGLIASSLEGRPLLPANILLEAHEKRIE